MPKLEMTGDYLLAVRRNDQRLSTRNTAWCLQEHNSSTIQITMLTPFIKKGDKQWANNRGRISRGAPRWKSSGDLFHLFFRTSESLVKVYSFRGLVPRIIKWDGDPD